MLKSKIILITAVMLTCAAVIGGCGKKQEEVYETQTQKPIVVETQPETEPETETESQFVVPEGKAISHLTGELVDEAVNNKRPVALMINNVTAALPQSGLSKADILYEAVVEGKITRLMAVFQDYENLEKVGPLRSCRHYYLDFAHDEEAIYGHFGWSIYAEDRIKREGIKTLHLMAGGINSDYYRATDRVAPHNVFMTGQQIIHAIDRFGATTSLPEGYESRLKFNTEDTPLAEGESAATVDISMTSKPHLEYDAQTGLYNKFQYGNPHMDNVGDVQLAFKNVIIQYAPYTCIDTAADCQDIALTGKGKGLYITDGKAINITWEKKDLKTDYTRYYTEDGKELILNQGKTYIAVIPTDYTVTLS